MIILVPVAAGVGLGLAMGGSLGNWSKLHLRWPWIAVAALLIRVVVAGTDAGSIDWFRYLYVAGLVALIGWTLWNADRLFGIWLVSLGSATNLVVIAANDFRMPAAVGATSRLAQVGHHGQYVVMDAATRLNWLGDWIVVRGWYGGIFSPGDVLISLGVGVVAFAITRFPGSRTKLDVPQANSQTETAQTEGR